MLDSGLDRKTREKLKKGEYQIDVKLDLHGYYMQDAYETLSDTVFDAYDNGLRCLLVVTGKGLHSSDPYETLKAQVPKWLLEPPISSKIITFVEAQRKHGGSGALYVLIKRKKDL